MWRFIKHIRVKWIHIYQKISEYKGMSGNSIIISIICSSVNLCIWCRNRSFRWIRKKRSTTCKQVPSAPNRRHSIYSERFELTQQYNNILYGISLSPGIFFMYQVFAVCDSVAVSPHFNRRRKCTETFRKIIQSFW